MPNKFILHKLCITILFLFYCFSAVGQKQDCKDNLKKIYSVFRDKNKFKNAPYVHFNYTIVQTVNSNTTDKVMTEKVDWYAGKNLNYLKGNTVECYQNTQLSVSIIPSENQIIISDAKNNNSPDKMAKFMAMQDTILQYCDVVSCQPETIKGVVYQKILLKPNAKLSQKFHVKSILYYVDYAKSYFYEIKIDYDNNSPLNQTLIRFNKIDYQYNGDIFKTKPLQLVFDANKQLLPNYKKYQIKDYRSKK